MRILEAVARENARARVLAEARRRRLVAALSWAYGAGSRWWPAWCSGWPSFRGPAGGRSGLAVASAAGLRAGLGVIDALSLVSAWASSVARFMGGQLDWVRTLGRAVETVGGAAGARFGGWFVLAIGVVLSSLVFVRFLHQREPEKEVPHVGAMLA